MNRTYKYRERPTIPLLKRDFRPVSLKATFRTQPFQRGTGPQGQEAGRFVATPGFVVTLDNYLQLYDARAMAPHTRDESVLALDGATENWRPTTTLKLTNAVQKGSTLTLTAKQPFPGFRQHRIGNRYELSIIKQAKSGAGKFFYTAPDGYGAFATWQNFRVNGHPYYVDDVLWAD